MSALPEIAQQIRACAIKAPPERALREAGSLLLEALNSGAFSPPGFISFRKRLEGYRSHDSGTLFWVAACWLHDYGDELPTRPPEAFLNKGGDEVIKDCSAMASFLEAVAMNESVPAPPIFQGGGLIASGDGQAVRLDSEQDPNVFVAASKVYPERFDNYKAFRRFLEDHPEIRRRKPSKQRLEIHAGDWIEYWAEHDTEEFEAADKVEPSPITPDDLVDDIVAAARTMDRYRQLRAKKSGK